MADIASSPLMTAEELCHLPDDGNRHELIDGVLTTMPPAGFEHGYVEVNVAVHVAQFVKQHQLGQVVGGETGFFLGRGPDTVLAPDVAFVSTARLPAPDQRARFADVVPDLVVEIVSPSDRPGEVTEKALRWVEAGVGLTWVVHPERRMVAVYEPGGVVHLVHEDEELDGGEVLPGFRLPVVELFG